MLKTVDFELNEQDSGICTAFTPALQQTEPYTQILHLHHYVMCMPLHICITRIHISVRSLNI